MKRSITDWEKIFAKNTSDQGLLPKHIQRTLETTVGNKVWDKDLNRHLTKKGVKMANKHMKRCFASYVIREMKVKTMMNTITYLFI